MNPTPPQPPATGANAFNPMWPYEPDHLMTSPTPPPNTNVDSASLPEGGTPTPRTEAIKRKIIADLRSFLHDETDRIALSVSVDSTVELVAHLERDLAAVQQWQLEAIHENDALKSELSARRAAHEALQGELAAAHGERSLLAVKEQNWRESAQLLETKLAAAQSDAAQFRQHWKDARAANEVLQEALSDRVLTPVIARALADNRGERVEDGLAGYVSDAKAVLRAIRSAPPASGDKAP